MNDYTSAERVDGLLHDLLQASGLCLTYKVATNLPGSEPRIAVQFDGPDAGLLTARDAELLLALEHVAAKSLRLGPEEHDQLSFEALGWKAARDRKLRQAAGAALAQVQTSGLAYEFPPMSSHERRLLHLALAPSGLSTVSEGEGPGRHLVLRPPPKGNAVGCQQCYSGQ